MGALHDCWLLMPEDIVYEHILPRCPIDVRLAFGILPRKMVLETIEDLLRPVIETRPVAFCAEEPTWWKRTSRDGSVEFWYVDEIRDYYLTFTQFDIAADLSMRWHRWRPGSEWCTQRSYPACELCGRCVWSKRCCQNPDEAMRNLGQSRVHT